MIRYRKLPWRAVADLPGRSTRESMDPRRIAAARKALEKKRAQDGLFAGDQISEEDAIARLVRFSDADETALRDERQRRASAWRNVRRALRVLPDEIRRELIWRWNSKRAGPAEPVYLATMIRGTCCPAACAILNEGLSDPFYDHHSSPYVMACMSPEILARLPELQAAARAKLDQIHRAR